MLEMKQKAAIGAAAAIPLAAGALFLGVSRPAKADAICGTQQCFNPVSGQCVGIGQTYFNTAVQKTFTCGMVNFTAQWS